MSVVLVVIFCTMGLLLVAAAVLVSSAVVAANRPIVPWQGLKSALSLALWIVPALGIVGAVALNSHAKSSRFPSDALRERALKSAASANRASYDAGLADSQRNQSRLSTATVRGFPPPMQRFVLVAGSALFLIIVGSTIYAFCNRQRFLGKIMRPGFGIAACALLLVAVVAVVGVEMFLGIGGPQHISAERYGEIVLTEPSSEGLPRSIKRPQLGYLKTDLSAAGQAGALVCLKSRQISSTAPQWSLPEKHDGDVNQIQLDSKLYATVEEAELDVTVQALARVQERFRDQSGLPGNWPVSVALIERHAVKDLVTEVVDHDFGEPIGKAKMYRAHLWLDYSANLREALFEAWRAQLVEQRLIQLGSIVALVTLMLGTAAGYFRLDDLTGGQHRGRLKFAAGAVLVAGSLAALVV